MSVVVRGFHRVESWFSLSKSRGSVHPVTGSPAEKKRTVGLINPLTVSMHQPSPTFVPTTQYLGGLTDTLGNLSSEYSTNSTE